MVSSRQKQPVPLQIFIACRQVKTPLVALHRLGRRLYRSEKISERQKISLVFCSDQVIHRLNAKYRNVDRPTDVLSFTLNDPDLLGEIYISLERVKKQAREYHVSCKEEILRLFIHGFFHLLGYDHEMAADRAKMELKERLYLLNTR